MFNLGNIFEEEIIKRGFLEFDLSTKKNPSFYFRDIKEKLEENYIITNSEYNSGKKKGRIYFERKGQNA